MEKYQINNLASEIEETLIEIRRTIHKNPELGCEISKTRDLVCEYLKKWSIKYELIENQGIVAEISGKKDMDNEKIILLRADMDALCINEKTEIECKSIIENRMHACGHDAHTAGMLGAGYILKKLENNFSGRVRLVFQPCEEDASGLNAQKLVDKGILLKDMNDSKSSNVDAAIAAHVFTKLKSGKIGINIGETTGVPGGFSIKIIGKQGHSSEPSKCIDPIMILNQIYSAIQCIQRSYVDPDRASVISVTYMNAGDLNRWNIIPKEAEIKGNIRTQYEFDNKKIGAVIESIVKNICGIYGADYEYDYRMYIESVKNDEYISKIVSDAVSELDEEIAFKPPLFMGGDDFCKISELVPSCYFFVGIGKGDNDYPIHSDSFELDEKSVLLISKVMSLSVLKLLEKK